MSSDTIFHEVSPKSRSRRKVGRNSKKVEKHWYSRYVLANGFRLASHLGNFCFHVSDYLHISIHREFHGNSFSFLFSKLPKLLV